MWPAIGWCKLTFLIASCTHRLDEEMSNSLPVMPLVDAAVHLFQKVLVVLQDLRDLVKHFIHQQRVHDGASVRLFERTHVAL